MLVRGLSSAISAVLSFDSMRHSPLQNSTGSDAWRVDFASQARQMGQARNRNMLKTDPLCRKRHRYRKCACVISDI